MNLINAALVALGLLCIGGGAIIGFVRGLFKSAVKLIAIVAVALLALPLTAIVTTLMGENAVALGSKVLAAFSISLEDESPNLAAASGSLLSAVSAVFVYFIIAVILLLLFLLVLAFLKKTLADAEKRLKLQPTASHGFGFLVGLLSGLLVFAVLTLPIVGVAHTANQTVVTLQAAESCPLDADTLQTLADSTETVMDFPVCRLSWAFPQKQLYRTITTVKTERGKSVLDDELHAAALMADDIFVITDSAVSSFGKAQAAAVIHMAESLGDTKMLPSLLAGFLSDASAKWLEDETYFGLDGPQARGAAAIVLKGAYLLFSTTTPETIEKDLLAFAAMLESLENVGLIGGSIDEQSVLKQIANGSFFDKFISAPDDDRSQIMNESVIDAVIKTIANKIGYSGSLEEARKLLDTYADKVVDLLAQSEGMAFEDRKAFLSENLAAYGAELGFNISVKDAETIAEQLLQHYVDAVPQNLSLAELLAAFAAAYVQE